MGYFFANMYTFLVLIMNVLHFNHWLLDGIAKVTHNPFTVQDINTLGMVAYEYFLAMALQVVWFIVISFLRLILPFSFFGDSDESDSDSSSDSSSFSFSVSGGSSSTDSDSDSDDGIDWGRFGGM